MFERKMIYLCLAHMSEDVKYIVDCIKDAIS